MSKNIRTHKRLLFEEITLNWWLSIQWSVDDRFLFNAGISMLGVSFGIQLFHNPRYVKSYD